MPEPEKALACFEEAGLKFDIRHFDHRLIAQKLTYLLQELGVKLGYEKSFSFYLRGTYSPTLTKDLFQAFESKKRVAVHLTQADKARIAQLRDAVPLRPHLLEVMAGYRFLRQKGQTEDQAIATLRSTKPFISPRDVAVGISKSKRLFPEVTGVDIAAMREEMRAWDAASDADWK